MLCLIAKPLVYQNLVAVIEEGLQLLSLREFISKVLNTNEALCGLRIMTGFSEEIPTKGELCDKTVYDAV
ncbi:hypothetical protein ANO14919_105250 [Xylariales sp. No.14919]|nr:hypothetical protein ANO14919_105250 [Xylariales sp. No.14919]